MVNYGTTSGIWSYVPPVVTSCSQVWYYFGQADLWSDVSPTTDISWSSMGTAVGQVDVWSDVPPIVEALAQVDILSDFMLARLLVFSHSFSC